LLSSGNVNPESSGGQAGASRKAEGPSVLRDPAYLDVTYSTQVAPRGAYPDCLGRWLLDHAFRRPGRLLDVGCGRGDYLDVFSRLGFAVAGVDISPRAAELAPSAEVRVADLETEPMPFPPSSFDFVFSKSVVEHLRQPGGVFPKILDVLKPGGVAVIMTPSWEHNSWGPFYIDHTHVTPFTILSLADLFQTTGFEAVEVSYFRQLPFLWRFRFLAPLVWLLARLPLPYRPYHPSAPWPDGFNKLVRFSKEVMILGIARKPLPGAQKESA